MGNVQALRNFAVYKCATVASVIGAHRYAVRRRYRKSMDGLHEVLLQKTCDGEQLATIIIVADCNAAASRLG